MSDPAALEPIMVIDDDPAIRLSCRKTLQKSGYRVSDFEDGAQGLQAMASVKPGLIVVDLKMPGLSGMEVVKRVRDIDEEIIIVVITGYATIDTAVEAMKYGAYDFLPKPFSPDELRLIVKRGLERRRLRQASRQAELERAVLRRRFITFVSHQLHTPLVAIYQYISVLKQLENIENAAAKREEWFNRCLKRIEGMQTLIHDWLTVARSESQGLLRERVSIDLKPVVLEVLDTYQELAEAEGVTMESRLPEGECRVSGDRTCLSVLFDNLVSNAIKYNRRGGGIVVAAETNDREVQVAVSDTGVGIPAKYQQLLFEEFFRVGAEEGKKAAGSGLGLAICKRIVTELGGSISVESEVNAGSTFTVRFLRDRGPEGGESANEWTENPDRG